MLILHQHRHHGDKHERNQNAEQNHQRAAVLQSNFSFFRHWIEK